MSNHKRRDSAPKKWSDSSITSEDNSEDSDDSEELATASSEFINHTLEFGHATPLSSPGALSQLAGRKSRVETGSKTKMGRKSPAVVPKIGGKKIPEHRQSTSGSGTKTGSGTGSGTGRGGFASGYQTGLMDDYDVHKKSGAAKSKSMASVPSTSGAADASSWEYWWIHSQLWKRKAVLMIFLLLLLSFMHLVAGIIFLGMTGRENKTLTDPYVCRTENCKDLDTWIRASRKEDNIANPCNNFYDFMCINHRLDDKMDLNTYWYENYANLEAEGETILSEVIEKSPDTMAKKVIKYYQVCIATWDKQNMNLEKSLTNLIQDIMKDFNLWPGQAELDQQPIILETMAQRLIEFLGDFGVFKVDDPVYSKILVHEFKFMEDVSLATAGRFLPIIYNAFGITDLKYRSTITRWLTYMTDKASVLKNYGEPGKWSGASGERDEDRGTPGCVENPNSFTRLWFTMPFRKILNLGENETLEFGLNADLQYSFNASFQAFFHCWNSHMEKITKFYIRPVYATLWSLRILIELIHDVDDDTAIKYGLEDKKNIFFRVYQNRYHGRHQASRCFQSLQDSMGYYPVFKYFQKRNMSQYIQEANRVINESAVALLQKFRPAEEGGLPWVSTFFRERAVRILSGEEDYNILVPTGEDDPDFAQELPEVTDDHVTNVLTWRRFTTNRTHRFRMQGVPRRRLIWYRDFYFLEAVNAFETPGYADFSILKFPASLFVKPYWENDMLVADYAGTQNLVKKSWMKLVSFDYRRTNVRKDHERWIELQEKREIGSSLTSTYREGSVSDGDYKYCNVLTYDWVADKTIKQFNKHEYTVTDPHFLSFRFGLKETSDIDWNQRMDRANGIFPMYTAIRTTFHNWLKKRDELEKADFSRLSKRDQNRVIYKRLPTHRQFTQEQLFFMLIFRDVCRSKSGSWRYNNHVTENMSGIMQMEEFRDAFFCPTGSGMNAPNQCFTGYATDGVPAYN